MKRLMLASLLALSTLPGFAAEPPADGAVFVEGARYNAVLHRQEQRWRLLPAEGEDMSVRESAHCLDGALPPRGLWLLTRDADGRATLVAPSATPLPPGHPGELRLVGCGQALPPGLPAMAVPDSLVDWLAEFSGVIYVTD